MPTSLVYLALHDEECAQEGVASFPGHHHKYYADRSLRARDRACAHYGPFRRVQCSGLVRAWHGAKVDHCVDPIVPRMRPLDKIHMDNSYAEEYRSEEAINRWSPIRQRWLLAERKKRRLKARQQDRHERQRQREWGWDWRQRCHGHPEAHECA